MSVLDAFIMYEPRDKIRDARLALEAAFNILLLRGELRKGLEYYGDYIANLGRKAEDIVLALLRLAQFKLELASVGIEAVYREAKEAEWVKARLAVRLANMRRRSRRGPVYALPEGVLEVLTNGAND